MKFLALYIFVIASAIAGTQSSQKEIKPNPLPALNSQSNGNKFFKTPIKKCNLESAKFEESLKACIKIERRWLHI